jgi:hypothetical protein
MVCGIAWGHRKRHAQIRQAVLKDAAQLVIANFADKPARHAQPCKARHRIGGRPAGAVGMHADAGAQRIGARAVDQRHRPFGRAQRVQRCFVNIGKKINQRGTHASDERARGHKLFGHFYSPA